MGDFFNSSQFEHTPEAQVESPEKLNNHAHVSLSHVANLTRKDEGLVIHRQKIASITVIGMVMHVEELANRNVYMIDDYTWGGNCVEVQFWKNESDENHTPVLPPSIKERTYIRVVGQARYDEKKPFIIAFTVEPIVDPNEIPTHFLEVIADNMILEKRKNATLNTMQVDESNISHVGGGLNQSNRKAGFTELQRAVLAILDQYSLDSADGLTRFEIKNKLQGVNGHLIDEALVFLQNEGHIFNTADEDTFKSAGE